MEDNIKAVKEFLAVEYDKGFINVTRHLPGDMAGEWLVVDDDKKLAMVVFLADKDSEGFDYEEVIEKYNTKIDAWMAS